MDFFNPLALLVASILALVVGFYGRLWRQILNF